jgi:hypothetical protein
VLGAVKQHGAQIKAGDLVPPLCQGNGQPALAAGQIKEPRSRLSAE